MNDHQATVRLIANFLRQIAGTDWSKQELAALADAVQAGKRPVIFDESVDVGIDVDIDLNGND